MMETGRALIKADVAIQLSFVIVYELITTAHGKHFELSLEVWICRRVADVTFLVG